MSEVDYLDLDDLVAAAEVAVSGRPKVRDWGLLESSLARAKASVFGEDAYPGLNGKAAALLDADYAAVRRLGDEYRKRNPRSLA